MTSEITSELKVELSGINNQCPSASSLVSNEVVEPSFRTLRKRTEACQIDLLNFDLNQSIILAGVIRFT